MAVFGSEAEPGFAALIGDVVSSRTSPDRSRLQRRLLQEMEELNDRIGPGLASPLALTGGDEVQGLLARPEDAVEIVVGLSEAIFPERLVFGLGYGALSTEIYPDVARIDGPCFHRARSGLGELGDDGWLTARGFDPAEDRAVTALFALMGAIRARWTEKQLAYARAARRRPQKKVAEEFGVSPSTVSESLKASSFVIVRVGEEAARELLRQFGHTAESEGRSAEEPK